MRILFLTLDFPPNFGGVANYYYHLCKSLGKKNEVIVLAPSIIQITNNDIELGGVTVLRKKMLSEKIFPKWLAALFYVWSIVRKKNIDLIIVGHILPLGYIALLYKFLFRIPYLVCAHGLDILAPQKNEWKFFWLKYILFFSKHIITNSNFVKQEVIKIGSFSDKTTTIYPCIDKEFIDKTVLDTLRECDALRQKYNLVNKKIILSIGRLVERKGFDVVINALPDVWEKFPDTAYIIIGSGPYKSFLQELAQKVMNNNSKYKDKIIFLDHVPIDDLCLYYNLCDVFIMVPKDMVDDPEGFGFVFLEANGFKKPVIGSRSGGVPEAIEHESTGLLVNTNNTQETASALLRLLSDKDLREKLGQQGRDRVISKFQWPLEIKKLEALLNKM